MSCSVAVHHVTASYLSGMYRTPMGLGILNLVSLACNCL